MKTRPSVMKHQFSQVPKARIQRSVFNRSHAHKTTFDSGLLIPIFCDEVLPGDTFNLRMNGFARMATPIFPVMDNAYMDTFFFFVPNRLLWDNWEKFMGAQDNPGDSTAFSIPQIFAPTGGWEENTLEDYFGIPTKVEALNVSSLWHRGYNLIYNEWFRDQNLQDSVMVPKDNGPDDTLEFGLLRRGKRHDYFTSCLPFPQKGDEVVIPLGNEAPVRGLGVNPSQTWPLVPPETDGLNESGANSSVTYASATNMAGTIAPAPVYLEEDPDNPGFPHLWADLTTASTVSINALREAFQIQRLLEKDARGGTRYTEILEAHFGVTSPDARLQRPEYLGGGRSKVNMSPIASTVPTSVSTTTPQGNLAAIGTVNPHGHGFTKSFTEHGIIIGMVCVHCDLTYQQGLNRMWSRQTKYDYYWPTLAHLGEQAVLSKEIYLDGTASDDTVFGYQERFAEYRYHPSKITGRFRSNSDVPLDAWHYSQFFANRPVLNAEFIEENPPVGRTIAIPGEPEFIFDSFFSVRCARPMPLYGVPGLIDHF